jgi:hypothetical protein
MKMKKLMLPATLVAVASMLAQLAQAQTYRVLYVFTGGIDGGYAVGTPLLHGGVLYGTTTVGGASGLAISA